MTSLICFRPQRKPSCGQSTSKDENGKKSSKNNGVYTEMVLQGPVEEGLSVQYVTPRIIVVTSPENGTEASYRSSLNALARHLKTKHSMEYRVWNAGRRRGDLQRGVGPENVVEVGWPFHLAPPLDRLCAVCKQFEQWLSGSESRVLLLHSKGDSERAAVLVSAFMHYNVICANEDSIEDRFSMQRYIDKHLGLNGLPSNKRYVQYFTSLLSGKIRVNPAPVYLKTTTDPSTTVEVGEEMRLRGDVLVKCFEDREGQRRLVFSCQFNTCVFPRPPPLLAFFKDQLDGISNDVSIDSQAQIEFTFGEHPPPGATRGSVEVRRNSYEDFGQLEDGDVSVEYSEIVKPTNGGTANSTAGANSEDSGISIESPKLLLNTSDDTSSSPSQPSSSTQEASTPDGSQSKGMAPPPIPPKPRPGSAMDNPESEYGEMPERRGVLPASVKPLVSRPPSPKEGPRSIPIEPDLVSKDRYDKASKCFSYAPTKDLKQAFDRPRKKSFSLPHDDQKLTFRPDEVNNVEVRATDIPRMPEEPKWTEEVDKARQEALRDDETRWRQRPAPPPRSHSSIGDTYSRRPYDEEERPMVVEQARKASTGSAYGSMRRKPKYGSYRTLNDDTYNSDMDDLCDPDFYFNQQPEPQRSNFRSQSTVPFGAKSVELPRKSYTRNEDPLEEILSYDTSSTARPMPASSIVDDDKDSFRQRNCRSVSTAPFSKSYAATKNSPYFRDRKLFAENYDALSDAAAPDDWLDTKLKKLKSKRNMDPDLVRRRTQEKMLLEELKNAHDDRQQSRNRRELDYSVEGVGQRQEPAADPLLEFRREEERLRNTNSPFDMDARRTPRQLRGKPPTPPPRERSRSPPHRAESTSRMNTPSEPLLNGHHQPHSRSNTDYQHANGYAVEEEYDDRGFSTLKNIVQNNRPESRPILKRPSYNTMDFAPRSHTPTHFLSGQERVANAIMRAETPNHFNYFPNGAATLDRSETPAFPVARETPLPFHPLLYNSASNLAEKGNYSQTLNYRLLRGRTQSSIVTDFTCLQMTTTAPPWRETSDPVSLASSESSSTCSSLSTSSRHSIVRSPILARKVEEDCSTKVVFTRIITRFEEKEDEGSSSNTSTSSDTSSSPSVSGSKEVPGKTNGTTTKERENEVASPSTPGIIKKPTNTGDVVSHHPIFVKDTSKYWYKPHISREQAISILRDKPPGTFVIRDSNSFPGAFGLALKVSQPPPGVPSGDGTELVRHFLIEPSPKGVKLKGCNNEPVFGTLSALVYQHSMTPLALPCKLLLPEYDPAATAESISATQALLEQGAACNVTFIGSVDCESLTGNECVRRAVQKLLDDFNRGEASPVSAHFKVSSQGVTLTDNTRKLFFRRHYPVHSVIFAGIDPSERRFDNSRVAGYQKGVVESARLFAFVARKFDRAENTCHVFAELEPEQPASAVVNFINKVMLAQRRQ